MFLLSPIFEVVTSPNTPCKNRCDTMFIKRASFKEVISEHVEMLRIGNSLFMERGLIIFGQIHVIESSKVSIRGKGRIK